MDGVRGVYHGRVTTRTPRNEELARTLDAAGVLATVAGGPDLDATLRGPPAPALAATMVGDASAALAATVASAPSRAVATELDRGTTIGRYVVVGRLGAGAMGVVYAAFDPELDRKVALKLLQSSGGDDAWVASADARARLLREAQALARLNHPNVVGVFDVGTHGDRVWLAMELVEGVTLRDWIAARTRDWTDILDVAQAVGRGLAAAHAAGLVHRDVKP